MTDDKGPYSHTRFPRFEGESKCSKVCPACAYAEGRKDERERCAHIAEHEAGEIPECMTGRIIAEKIRGGQGAE